MARGLFVTGTDTDVGKTVVSCALMSVLARRGWSVVGFKPVAAGAERTTGGLRNSDARWLKRCSSIPVDYEDINPFVLEAAIAPHIAARTSGILLEQGTMLECRRRLGDKAQVVVTEGAGGWMVPLSPDGDMADLAAAINDPVILVVGMKLGCLNHALLTARAIRNRGCRLAGWVANRLDADMPAFSENVDTLVGKLGCRPLASVPWLGDAPMERKIELACLGIDDSLLEVALATD